MFNSSEQTKMANGEGSTEEEIVKDIVSYAKQQQNNSAVGRFQGYGLIYSGSGFFSSNVHYNWIKSNYPHAKQKLADQSVNLLNWTSLSHDEDDKADYGVKFKPGCR